MKRLLCIAIVFAAMQAHATELVVNGSFETPPADASWSFNPDGPYQTGSFTGWTSTGQSGHWKPNLGVATFPSMLDGVQAGFTGDGISGGTLTQDLNHVLQPGEKIVLSAALGDRADLPAFNIPSAGSVTFLADSSTIASFSLVGNGSGFWNTVTFNLSLGYLSQFVGKDLSVRLSSADGEQMSFDKISVDSQPVPEPASMAVLGLGVVALIKRRRK